jgi:hypothetical protein
MSNQAGLGIGDKVHNEEINEYPEELREEYLRVSDWVRNTYDTYGRQVWIKVIDPQSLVGMWKHIRYGVRKYPTFILDGAEIFAGWNTAEQALGRVDTLLAERRTATQTG